MTHWDPAATLNCIAQDIPNPTANSNKIPSSRFVVHMKPMQVMHFASLRTDHGLNALVGMTTMRHVDDSSLQPFLSTETQNCNHLLMQQFINMTATLVMELRELHHPNFLVWIQLCQTFTGALLLKHHCITAPKILDVCGPAGSALDWWWQRPWQQQQQSRGYLAVLRLNSPFDFFNVFTLATHHGSRLFVTLTFNLGLLIVDSLVKDIAWDIGMILVIVQKGHEAVRKFVLDKVLNLSGIQISTFCKGLTSKQGLIARKRLDSRMAGGTIGLKQFLALV